MNHRYPESYSKKIPIKGQFDITGEQNVIQKKSPVNSESYSKWPMDSPWPMYSHDVHHTGLSPFSTCDNPLLETWRFPLDWGTFYAGFILDSDGMIYGGPWHIYGIYPNGTMKWSYNPGWPIESTPAIDENGILYIGTIWGMPNYLHAIYSNNGTQKWAYYVGNDIDSSPTIGWDGTIYFGDWSGYVHAVNPDGTQKWIYQTGDVITSSPAIGDDGTIYIGSHDDYVYAFYPTGTVKWRYQTGAWVHSSPTIGADGTVYIGSDDSYLYALNPEDGSLIWRCHVGGGTWCSPTIGSDRTLFLGTYDKRFQAISPDGILKWTYNAPGRIWFGSSATVSSDGTIYFGTTTQDGGSGALIALNPDGTERFRDNYGFYATSPAISEDGTVYAASFDYNEMTGVLHAFGPGEQKTIAITQPKPGGIYLLGINLGSSPNGKTIILGSVKVKAQPSMENEVESVSFIVDGSVQNTTTKPPFEWTMNQRYGKWPLMKHTLTVTAFYKGGCEWSESIPVWYFHLL